MDHLKKLYPESAEAVSEIIREAERQGTGIIPCGKGHLVNRFICRSAKPSTFISTAKLRETADLDIRNLSVKVQAGKTLAELQNELKKYNLFLPISAASHGSRTLGGLAIENAAGFEGYAYGSMREYILGLEFITPEGTQVKTGGKTVKNVSGYDFTRLFSGSWGTLGVITSLTLMVKPIPEKRTVLEVELPTLGEAIKQALQIKNERLCLSGIKIFKKGIVHGGKKPWKLIVGLGGFKETVELHLEKVRASCDSWPLKAFPDINSYWENYYKPVNGQIAEPLSIRGGKAVFWHMERDLEPIVSLPMVSSCEIDLGMDEVKIWATDGAETELQQQIIRNCLGLELSFDWLKPPVDPLYEKLKAALDPSCLMFPCHEWLGRCSL